MENFRKDILFLCQFFYPEYNSSATLPFDTAKYLASQGFSVDGLVGYPKEYSVNKHLPLEETVDGVGIKRIKYIQLSRTGMFGRLINYFSFTLHSLLQIRYLRNYKSVIVYSNPPVLPIVPVLANKMFGTRFVFVAYDVYPEVAYASGSLNPGGMIDKVMKRLNRDIYKRASMVVALTDEMKSFLLQNRTELCADRVTVIPNWAHETAVCTSPGAKAHFGFTPDQFVVGYFGNMGICQDMETLLGAMRELKDEPDYAFLFVGHGNKKERVESFIRDEGIENAKIYGFLVGEEFEQALAAADCCVVSLEKGLVGMCAPSKYYSYLQAGKPVIAVVEEDSYLWREMVRENVGFAAEIGDAETLAQLIRAMVANGTSAMAERAQALYKQNYTIEHGLEKYEEMMRKLIKEK